MSENNGWILCSDQLPPMATEVKALTNKGRIIIAWIDLFDDEEFGLYEDWETYDGFSISEFVIKWRGK